MDDSSANDIDIDLPTTPAPSPTEGEPPAPLSNASRQERLGMILGLHKAGTSTDKISKMTGIPATTVWKYNT